MSKKQLSKLQAKYDAQALELARARAAATVANQMLEARDAAAAAPPPAPAAPPPPAPKTPTLREQYRGITDPLARVQFTLIHGDGLIAEADASRFGGPNEAA